MLGKRIDLRDELRKARKSGDKIILDVRQILADNQKKRDEVSERLRSGNFADSNDFDIDMLIPENVFHLSHIKKVCIDYRLRFLDSNMYKNGLPEEAISKIMHLEKAHQTKLAGFKIAAPSKAFALQNYDDPLLFAPIGNGYYYLVHKWGNDMSRWRKWLVLPFRNLMNFVILCIVISLVLTWMTPDSVLSRKVPMASTIIFLFLFKSVLAVLMYGFFMGGRRFNDMMWNSRFYNN